MGLHDEAPWKCCDEFYPGSGIVALIVPLTCHRLERSEYSRAKETILRSGVVPCFASARPSDADLSAIDMPKSLC